MIFTFVIVLVITALYAYLIIYLLFGWIRKSKFELKTNQNSTTSVSVIIVARNEADNIADCLEALLQQDYQKNLYEIIVVDDHSEDNTAEIIRSYGHKIKGIPLSEHDLDPNLVAFKKRGIEIAVDNADGELIITTDADCMMGKSWVSTIVSYYEKYKPKMICGSVLCEANQSLVQQFQKLDFLVMAGVSGALINNKQPIMCNGANLAYEKSAFKEVGGYKTSKNIASGDDVHLLNTFGKRFPNKIHLLISNKATVYTRPLKSWKKLFYQRVRWGGKAKSNSSMPNRAIAIVTLSFNLVPIFLIISHWLSANSYRLIAIGYWLLTKILLDLIFIKTINQHFKQKLYLSTFLIIEIIHIFYIAVIGICSNFVSPKWKGRSL